MSFTDQFYNGVTGNFIPSNQFTAGEEIGFKFSGLTDPADTVILQITYDNKSISPLTIPIGINNFLSGTAQGFALFPVASLQTAGTAKITVETPAGNVTEQSINFGVNQPATPSPAPPDSTNIISGVNNLLTDIPKYVNYALIAACIIGGIWLIGELSPGIAKGVKTFKKEKQ